MTRSAIDWDAVRNRLRASERALEASLGESPERIEAAYRKRAVQLANLNTAQTPAAPGIPALVFRLGEERYAIELHEVAEVLPFAGCALVPGSAPGVEGVMNVRGDLRPVFDLSRLLSCPASGSQGEDGGAWVLMLRREGRQIGLKVQRVESLTEIRPEELTPVAGATRLKGRAPGKPMLLDVDAVLADVFRGVTTE